MASIPGEETAAVVATLLRYRGVIVPAVRRQLRGHRELARRIADPSLRQTALRALAEKASNAEATAVLCVLAPRRGRPAVLRAATALQVAIDYLDLRGERIESEAPAPGLALHAPLATAFGGAAATAAHPPGAFAGAAHPPGAVADPYLERLLARCRAEAAALPAAAAILPLARRAAIRCGEAQSYTHAAAANPEPLRRWALGLEEAPAGLEWWEIGAGASSSVAAHALLALAATPGAARAEGELLAAAYSGPIGALTVLLDDLVDRAADRRRGEHSYLDYYPSDAAAAERLAALAAAAREAAAALPRRARHRAILAGVLAYYLSAPTAADPGARALRDRVLGSSGPTVRALWLLLGGRRAQRERSG